MHNDDRSRERLANLLIDIEWRLDLTRDDKVAHVLRSLLDDDEKREKEMYEHGRITDNPRSERAFS